MWLNSIIAYFHFIGILVMFSSLIVEISLLNGKITKDNIRLITKADLFFGIFAGITVITGLLRMFYFGKGVDYYLINPLFIIKLTIFILVGLLSVYPTITFLKSRKVKDKVIILTDLKRIKLIVAVEIIFLLLIPFLGVLVRNGYGI